MKVKSCFRHCCCLGLCRKLIKIWISPKQRGEVRTEFKTKLSAAQIDEISEKLLSMNDWIPREFARNEKLF